MPNLNEADNKPNDDGLDGLNEKDRKETEDIIKEIGVDAKDTKPPVEEKPKEEAEKPKPEVPKPEEKPEEKPEPKPEEKSRKVKLIPAEVHYTARDKWEKREKELKDELDAARKGAVDNPPKPKEDQPDADLRKQTDKIAEKYGTDPDEEYERAVIARGTQPTAPKVEIPKEITEGIEEINKYKQEKQLEAEEAHFKGDFDSKILPLIKAEYGDDVPQATVEKIRDAVKDKAYSDTYEKVPLTTIYKGEDEFRSLIPEKQRGSEKSRGGYQASQKQFQTDELDLNVEQSGEVVEKMTAEQFDTYSSNMAKRERR